MDKYFWKIDKVFLKEGERHDTGVLFYHSTGKVAPVRDDEQTFVDLFLEAFVILENFIQNCKMIRLITLFIKDLVIIVEDSQKVFLAKLENSTMYSSRKMRSDIYCCKLDAFN